VALVVNAVVGAAIFGLPATVYGLVGAYSPLAVALCAIGIGLVVLCFAEVSSRYDATGGPFLYVRDAFGPAAGFAAGWLLWVARLTGAAAICGLMAQYLAFFSPVVGAGLGRAAVVVAALGVLGAVHVRGVRLAAVVGDAVTVAKLVPLLAVVGVGAFALDPSALALGPPPALGEWGRALLLLCFAFSGFETAVIAAGESRDPRRDLPFALGVGIAVVAALYVAVFVVCVALVPGLAESARPLADASARLFGPAGATVVVLGAVLSMTGTLHTALFACSRLAFAMGDAGVLPRGLARVHPRFRTPAVAMVVSVACILVLALASGFQAALTVSTAARLLVYGASCAALPVLRRRVGAAPARFRVPGAPLVWGGALALIAALLACVTAGQARVLVASMALGVVARLLTGRARRGAAVP
jgi:amino acid transporter